MRIPLIDKFVGLCVILGRARTAKVRYAQRGTYRRQPGATNLDNPILDQVQSRHPSGAVDDILTGAARTEAGGQKPLSVSRLYAILQVMPIINTRQIQLMLALDPRQARRYLAALRLALPFLIRALHHQQKQRRLRGQK